MKKQARMKQVIESVTRRGRSMATPREVALDCEISTGYAAKLLKGLEALDIVYCLTQSNRNYYRVRPMVHMIDHSAFNAYYKFWAAWSRYREDRDVYSLSKNINKVKSMYPAMDKLVLHAAYVKAYYNGTQQ